MRFANRTERIAGAGADAWDIHYEALRRRAAGESIIVLSVGDPDFDTPPPIVEAAVKSLQSGRTHYEPVLGTLALREAISAHLSQQEGVSFSEANIAVMAGAQCGLFAVAQCLFDLGDEAVVVDPTYVTYGGFLGASGAVPITVAATPADGFRVRPEAIEAAISPRTRAVIINTPHNPTGSVLSREALAQVLALCQRYGLWLVADEVYADLVFDGQHVSAASLPGAEDQVIVVGSLSKSHAMTGWRLGWVAGPEPLIGHLANLGLALLYGCPGFIQDAAVVALRECRQDTENMRLVYQQRRDAVCKALAGAPGITITPPAAGMFCMVDVRGTGLSAQTFSQRLLREKRVATLAGDAFGLQSSGHLRLGLVEPENILVQACNRIRELASEVVES